jgi:hypothetical protein
MTKELALVAGSHRIAKTPTARSSVQTGGDGLCAADRPEDGAAGQWEDFSRLVR